MVIVLVGPAGSGTTTVGTALAGRLGWMFVDADDLHESASPATLAAAPAIPAPDRAGGLERLHTLIGRALDRRESLVLACPSLTHAHLQRLIDGLRPVRVVYLKTDRDSHEETRDAALVLDSASEADAMVEQIRRAFGV